MISISPLEPRTRPTLHSLGLDTLDRLIRGFSGQIWVATEPKTD